MCRLNDQLCDENISNLPQQSKGHTLCKGGSIDVAKGEEKMCLHEAAMQFLNLAHSRPTLLWFSCLLDTNCW